MNPPTSTTDKLAFATVVVIAVIVGAVAGSVVVGVAVLAVANLFLGALLLLRARRADRLNG